MTNEEISWVAGLIEGEGTIGLYGGRRGYDSYPTLRVGMTDEDVIRRIHTVSQVGNVHTSDRGPGRKRMWIWSVAARDEVLLMLEAVLPWMGTRRSAKIEEALQRLERPFRIGPEINPCGTYAGSQRHKRDNEPECDLCLIARREYQKEWERHYRAEQRGEQRRREGLRQRIYCTLFGETKTAEEWSRDDRCPVSGPTIIRRLRKGQSVEEAVLTPSSNIKLPEGGK